MRTPVIVNACNILASAKLGKMTAPDKAKVVKAFRALKDAAKPFNDLLESAREKLKPEGWDELRERADKLTAAEQAEMEAMFHKYTRAVDLTVREEQEREHDVEFERLSAEAFEALSGANDWTVAQVELLESVLVEEA